MHERPCGQVPLETLARDAELSHQSVQSRPRHSETCGGVADNPTRLPEYAHDMLPLHLL